MNVIFFETLDSTNTHAKKHIDEYADKTVIWTKHQTAGRGRFTRSWVNVGTENIYLSIVLKPSDATCDIYSNLTQYLSVCLCKMLEELNLNPKIKWPNDVLLSGKKVCGILAETVMQGGKLKGIVLGIGVNLNVSDDILGTIDIPATSVNLELGRNIDRHGFMQNLLERFFSGYDKFLHEGFVSIKEYYLSRAEFLNQNISLNVFNSVKHGNFIGFGDDGTLILENNGLIENINMGEIV